MSMFTTSETAERAHHPTPVKTPSAFVIMQPQHRLLVLAGFWAYFAGVMILALFNQTTGAEWVIPALMVFIGFRVVPLILYRPSYGWFHPLIFGALWAMFGLVKAFSSHAWGLEWHLALPEYGRAQLAMLVAYELVLHSVSLLAYYLGFLVGSTPGVPRLTFSQPRYLALKVLLVVAFTGVVFAFYLEQQGGLMAHLLSWGYGRHINLAGEFYWLQFNNWAVFACLIWFILDRKAVRQPLFWVYVIISLGLIFLGTGGRSNVINAILIGLMVWMIRQQKIVPGKILLAGLVAIMLINVLGNFRRSTWRGEVDWQALITFDRAAAFSTDEIVARSTTESGVLPVLARVPQQVDFLYGDSYLAILTQVVPRNLWPDKPGLVGGRVGRTFFNVNAGVPPGPLGEAYWNFHISGVLIVFFLFGKFHKWVVAVFERYSREPAAILLYVQTLFLFSPWGLGITQWLLAIIPTLFLLWAFGTLSFRADDKSA